MTLSYWYQRLRAHGANLDAWEREERDLAQHYRELWARYVILVSLVHCPSCKEPVSAPPTLAPRKGIQIDA